MCSYIITFSDNRRITVSATTEAQARNMAYRIDGGMAIVDVVPA